MHNNQIISFQVLRTHSSRSRAVLYISLRADSGMEDGGGQRSRAQINNDILLKTRPCATILCCLATRATIAITDTVRISAACCRTKVMITYKLYCLPSCVCVGFVWSCVRSLIAHTHTHTNNGRELGADIDHWIGFRRCACARAPLCHVIDNIFWYVRTAAALAPLPRVQHQPIRAPKQNQEKTNKLAQVLVYLQSSRVLDERA